MGGRVPETQHHHQICDACAPTPVLPGSARTCRALAVPESQQISPVVAHWSSTGLPGHTDISRWVSEAEGWKWLQWEFSSDMEGE
eukprot:10427830-Prorocentrum_lima.AAC.1